jgi:hypothetical protein
MIKFKRKMPYHDKKIAVGNMTRGCVFHHENGKYWSYKKYLPENIPGLITDIQSSLKWVSRNSSLRSEL